MYAAANNPYPEVIVTLLKAGANPKTHTEGGITAFAPGGSPCVADWGAGMRQRRMTLDVAVFIAQNIELSVDRKSLLGRERRYKLVTHSYHFKIVQ